MDSEFQTQLIRVREFINNSQPVGYGQSAQGDLLNIFSLLSNLKSLVSKSESNFIPTEKAIKSWQLLTASDFQKQRKSFLDMLDQLEMAVENIHFPALNRKTSERSKPCPSS